MGGLPTQEAAAYVAHRARQPALMPAQHYVDLLNACSVASFGWLDSVDAERLAQGDWGMALQDVMVLRERFNALLEMVPGYWDLPEDQQTKPTVIDPDNGR